MFESRELRHAESSPGILWLTRGLCACALSVCVAVALLAGRVWNLRGPTVHAANTSQLPLSAPAYTVDGKMLFPAKYREWTYLTTGTDMSYGQASGIPGHSMFDNVFVNPEAYRSFLQTGTWPDKAIMLIEVRGAEGRGSINKRGHFQGADAMALEVHVKDDSRTPGNWAFYEFSGNTSAEKIPTTEACYSCHEQHGAVATTFVQFYPTLLPIAKQKKTLSPAYLKEGAGK